MASPEPVGPAIGDRVRCLTPQTLLTHEGRIRVEDGALATVSSVNVHGPGTVRAWLDAPRYEVPLAVGEWELVAAPGGDTETSLRLRDGDQPLPVANDEPCVQDAVIADVERRRVLGIARYGTALQPHNGRDALRDAYEEALDLACYLKQAIMERDGG